jgi:FkbM family methyltransferase
MLNNFPITRVKISIAKILYKLVVPFFGKKSRTIKRNGIYYNVDLSEGIDLSLFLFGNFQSHVTQNKFLELTPDAMVLDVGGNFGIMALQFAKVSPKGEVISFEPTHYAISKFKKNLEINPGLNQRISIVNSFVSSESTENANIQAFSSWKVSGEKGPKDQHPVHLGSPKSTEGVGSITLDDFSSDKKLTKIDLIKIDTDGHEFMVLNGAIECIKKYRPKVIFEVGQYVMKERNIDFSFYLNYFSKLHYRLVDSKSGNEITEKNQNKIIPSLGTIDVIALPVE